jgi:gluconate kinase
VDSQFASLEATDQEPDVLPLDAQAPLAALVHSMAQRWP